MFNVSEHNIITLTLNKGEIMWNWTFEASVEGQVSSSEIWRIWTNVEDWSSWDKELEWSRIDGPFTAGTEGHLKPKDWSPLKFKITEAIDGKEFKNVTIMPLGTTLKFHHFSENISPGRCRITHRVHAKGLLAPILRLTLRRKLKAKLPHALQALIVKAGEINE